MRASVLFTVGTDHHQFDRLIRWAEDWASTNRESVDVLVQHGSSRTPAGVSAYTHVPQRELTDLMTHAVAVVTHGGGGSITQCWRAGSVPIVVPRLRSLGEHVDDHQEAFAKRIAEMGYADIARSYDELATLLTLRITGVRDRSPVIDVSKPTRTAATVGRLIEDLMANQNRKRLPWHRATPRTRSA